MASHGGFASAYAGDNVMSGRGGGSVVRRRVRRCRYVIECLTFRPICSMETRLIRASRYDAANSARQVVTATAVEYTNTVVVVGNTPQVMFGARYASHNSSIFALTHWRRRVVTGRQANIARDRRAAVDTAITRQYTGK